MQKEREGGRERGERGEESLKERERGGREFDKEVEIQRGNSFISTPVVLVRRYVAERQTDIQGHTYRQKILK